MSFQSIDGKEREELLHTIERIIPYLRNENYEENKYSYDNANKKNDSRCRMKVVVKKSKNYWYKNSIGVEFDVVERVHPTFRYREFILENTEKNREKFKDDELTLFMLEKGHMGIRYGNACKCQNDTNDSGVECGYHFSTDDDKIIDDFEESQRRLREIQKGNFISFDEF